MMIDWLHGLLFIALLIVIPLALHYRSSMLRYRRYECDRLEHRDANRGFAWFGNPEARRFSAALGKARRERKIVDCESRYDVQ